MMHRGSFLLHDNSSLNLGFDECCSSLDAFYNKILLLLLHIRVSKGYCCIPHVCYIITFLFGMKHCKTSSWSSLPATRKSRIQQCHRWPLTSSIFLKIRPLYFIMLLYMIASQLSITLCEDSTSSFEHWDVFVMIRTCESVWRIIKVWWILWATTIVLIEVTCCTMWCVLQLQLWAFIYCMCYRLITSAFILLIHWLKHKFFQCWCSLLT